MEKVQELLESAIGQTINIYFARNETLAGTLKAVFPDYIVIESGRLLNNVMLSHILYFNIPPMTEGYR